MWNEEWGLLKSRVSEIRVNQIRVNQIRVNQGFGINLLYLKVEKPTGQLIAISNIITTPIDTILNHFRWI